MARDPDSVRHHVESAALGWIGVAWSPRGIVRILFAEATADRVRRRLTRELPGSLPAAPVPDVVDLLRAMAAHLAGEAQRFDAVRLDEEGLSPFRCRVLREARTIRSGDTVTYGELARRVGRPTAARAVGRTMALNPFPLVVPCHRVVASSGRLGGFSLEGGARTKRILLDLERRAPADEPHRPSERAPVTECR